MLRGAHWPGCDELNHVLAARAGPVRTTSGQPLRFVGHDARQARFEDRYEPRIYLRGEVQLRGCNWHDLFNALVWLTFPAAKAALNARHYEELLRQRASGAANRGPAQDALTLFDEGGVIVAVSKAGLAAMLSGCEWKELFWRRRAETARCMHFYLFGHALYEKALQPYAGVTGRGVLINVTEAFFDLPLARQLTDLDAWVAARTANSRCFTKTRALVPVPVLGVPGWCEDNEREQYYDNAGYFRPARTTDRR